MLCAATRLRHCLLSIGRSYSILKHVPFVKPDSVANSETSQTTSLAGSIAALKQMTDPLLQTVVAANPPAVFYHYPCADGEP
jgi:hypothetical protein